MNKLLFALLSSVLIPTFTHCMSEHTQRKTNSNPQLYPMVDVALTPQLLANQSAIQNNGNAPYLRRRDASRIVMPAASLIFWPQR